MRTRALIAVFALAGVGCADNTTRTPELPAVEDDGGPVLFSCDVGQVAHGEGCCDIGDQLLEDGACLAPGVAACAEGFASDGARGCRPILPSEPCTGGMLATPGDEACRDLADCGEGTWGNIATDSHTQHVDEAYVGASDGSATQPWPTIAEAVEAAAPGAVVAVAAGSYAEEVIVEDKAIELRGRCPQLVDVVPPSADTFTTVSFRQGASGSVVSGLSVTGKVALFIYDADMTVEQMWLHDVTDNGIGVGYADVLVSDVLVSGSAGKGMAVTGGSLTIERTALRDVALHGLSVFYEPLESLPASLALRSSHLQRAGGIRLFTADATIEDTVVTDSHFGLSSVYTDVAFDPTVFVAPTVAIRGSVFERNDTAGVLAVGTHLSVEGTTIRDTRYDDQFAIAHGVHADAARDALLFAKPAGSLSLTSSLVAGTEGVGVYVGSLPAELMGVWVNDTTTDPNGDHGDALIAITTDQPSSAKVSFSRLERSARAGVAVHEANVSLSSARLECNGVQLASPAALDDPSGYCGCGADAGCNTTNAPPPPTGFEPPPSGF